MKPEEGSLEYGKGREVLERRGTEPGDGGDKNGWDLRQSLYTANLLNQYSQRTVPGFVDIIGIALATNPVYVNGQIAYRKGEYFRKELSFNNVSAPVWEQVTVTATDETPVTGNLFVPRTPEPFTYDLDGNMTSDARWNYTWDAENRLVKVESRSDTPQASWRRVEWQFDALGRRIRQITSDGSSGTWQVTEDLKFVSDPLLFGRHIAELRAPDNALVRSYVWGLDLSGTMDGAGGVGGLLWVTLHTASGAAPGTHFCAYDGNGNIVALLAASDGLETARYEYGPFGEPIRVTGPAATNNPFRFSTKRTCNTTDLVLYEYRAYSPSLGRWLSRDPIEERGGINVYGYIGNAIPNRIDLLGLKGGKPCCESMCELLGAVEIIEVLPVLLPGSQKFGEPYVLDEMAKAIKVLITIGCRRHSRYVDQPAKILVDLAKDRAREKDIELNGVQIWTILVYRKCESGRCSGFIGAVKKLFGKCGPYHWVVYQTEERSCKPNTAEEHPLKPGNFLRDAADAAVPRCQKEHEHEFNRLLRK